MLIYNNCTILINVNFFSCEQTKTIVIYLYEYEKITYYISGYFELAEGKAAITHHSVISEVSLHAVQQRGNDTAFKLYANTRFLLAFNYVE